MGFLLAALQAVGSIDDLTHRYRMNFLSLDTGRMHENQHSTR